MNEETREQQNELETQRLNIEARMASVLPSVIDYVTGLSGFKNKYPAAAAEYATAKEEEADVEVGLSEWKFRIGEWVNAGDELLCDGRIYEVLQGHYLQEDWKPGEVPALYRLKSDPGEEWPEWIQPTGAHDTYAKGAKVTYKGQHYVSLIDNNSWSPEAYPAGWELQP